MNRNTAELDAMEQEVEELIEKGELAPARAILQKMLRIDPNGVAAHFQLARVFRKSGHFEKALSHARRTLVLSPQERNAHLNLGLIYECQDKWPLAKRHYLIELGGNPDSPETLWNLGNLWYDRRQWVKAAPYLQRCLRIGYKTREVTDKLGSIYSRMGALEPYIAVFENYIRLFPGDAWGQANLGRAYMHAKEYKKALLRLRRAVALGSTEASKDLQKLKRKLAAV